MSAQPTPVRDVDRSSTHGLTVSVPERVAAVDTRLSTEQRRSRHVERLSVVSTAAESPFDRITSLACTLFGVPMSSVTLIDDDLARFPGTTGFDDLSTAPRRSVFCDRTVEIGEPVIVEDATADERFADLPLVTSAPYLRFYAGVPLDDDDGVTVGTFCLFDTVPRRLDRAQLSMLVELAAWARRELVDSAEMERARAVQRSLLPKGTAAPEGYELAGICLPTKGVGGDFFDHAVVNGKLVLTLMDVMGKGTGAALVAASVRAIIRANVSHQVVLETLVEGADVGRLTRVIAATDALVTDDLVQTGTLVTGFAALLEPETGELSWVDAGHGLAVIVRADGTTERLVSNDLPVGLGLGEGWGEHRSTLDPGDTLLVVSDGLFDLLGGTAQAFDEGIRYLVQTDPDPEALMDRIAELTSLGSALDDVTVLAVRRTGDE